MTLYTKFASFRVHSKQNNHLWLEVLEGSDKGLRVSVPIVSNYYGDSLQDQVADLEVDDIITASLHSRRKDNPNWKISQISKVNSALHK